MAAKTKFIVFFKPEPLMKNGKITLALVDDHQIVIDGLTSFLLSTD